MTEEKFGGPIAPPAPELLLAAIVNSSEDAIVSKNLDGIITSWNAAAQRMFGYSAEEAVGRSVLMLVPADRKEEEPRILARLRTGERLEHFETIRVRKDGELFPVSLTISPIRDPSGRVVGASKIARDITLLQRISAEREQLLKSERAARAQAEHASQMKDDFLATVSHELRTPLNAIVGWTEVLKEAGGDPAELAHGLEVIQRNAHAQAQLIDDLLDLGRIVSGKVRLELAPVDLAELAAETVASQEYAAGQKEIRVELARSEPGVVLGDRHRLQQIVGNLLANAIKFTPQGGRIGVEVRRGASRIDIAVTDNGQGIAPDFLPHVFDRFRQADASTTRQSGGLGIGLSLVRQLAGLHGGEVSAASEGLGRGATFTVSLPVASPAAPGARPAGAFAVPKENLAGIRILAVDDDRDSLEIMKRILEGRHAEVLAVSSVVEALACFGSFKPRVVLSDIGMPEHDGYELIRRMRQSPNAGQFAAAAVTALARPDDQARALAAGFDAHLAKPILPGELVAVVRRLASRPSTAAEVTA